jgi:pyruvate formate-lyase/glycerol dehydratase family glycyl radical enzyme
MAQTVSELDRISSEEQASKQAPHEWGLGSTPRTAALRAELKWKAAVIKDFEDVISGLGKCEFRESVRIDVDRARFITESFRQTDGQPWATRQAKASAHLCEKLPIFIKAGELIVGDPNSAPDELRWHPEIDSHYMADAVTTGSFSEMVTDAEREEIVSQICAFWDGRGVADRIKAVLPEDLCQDVIQGFPSPIEAKLWEMGPVSQAYEFPVLFKQGVQARIETAQQKLKELNDRAEQIPPAEYLEKKTNWEAMIIGGKGLLRFAQRYAELARRLAADEKDDGRKRELEEIAATLDQVPARPARTFREAVQFYWMIEVAARFMPVYGHGCGFRFDQIFWPYYEADIRQGRITRDEALELIECLFLKIQELGIAVEWPVTFTGQAGAEIFYALNICGSKDDGSDASNDLSCLAMEAMANLHLNQPPLALRYHGNISPEIVDRAIDLLHLGMGHPSWYNEDLMKKGCLLRGYSPAEAQRVQMVACVTNVVDGMYVVSTGAVGVGGMILPKILEEALREGGPVGDPDRPDKPKTKDPREMRSADELLEAFLQRVSFYTKQMAFGWNLAQEVLMNTYPDPVNSLLLDEPLERGIDLKRLHKEHDTYPAVFIMGQITTADSLAAVQKLVFDERKYTMDELLTALGEDWEGYEAMRQDFLHAPKYGNDDDYADAWTVKLTTRFEETLNQVTDAWGSKVTSDGSTAAGYQMVGLTCGATPDGRKAMTVVSDGSRSPIAGADHNGPTAVLNSAAKIPYQHADLLNQRFMPVFLENGNKRLFAAYLREWYDKGTVPHIQFNVVDNAVLRDAQEHPENYRDLQVRVAGYSAFWIDLCKDTQDSIIARTEHCF